MRWLIAFYRWLMEGLTISTCIESMGPHEPGVPGCMCPRRPTDG